MSCLFDKTRLTWTELSWYVDGAIMVFVESGWSRAAHPHVSNLAKCTLDALGFAVPPTSASCLNPHSRSNRFAFGIFVLSCSVSHPATVICRSCRFIQDCRRNHCPQRAVVLSSNARPVLELKAGMCHPIDCH